MSQDEIHGPNALMAGRDPQTGKFNHADIDSYGRQAIRNYEGYYISDQDVADPNLMYYGFLGINGEWYILKQSSTDVFRYIAGSSGYTAAWTNRASLGYDYFNIAF